MRPSNKTCIEWVVSDRDGERLRRDGLERKRGWEGGNGEGEEAGEFQTQLYTVWFSFSSIFDAFVVSIISFSNCIASTNSFVFIAIWVRIQTVCVCLCMRSTVGRCSVCAHIERWACVCCIDRMLVCFIWCSYFTTAHDTRRMRTCMERDLSASMAVAIAFHNVLRFKFSSSNELFAVFSIARSVVVHIRTCRACVLVLYKTPQPRTYDLYFVCLASTKTTKMANNTMPYLSNPKYRRARLRSAVAMNATEHT